jgi:hypothetical protein
VALDVDGTFPMRRFMHHLDMRFKSYRGLKMQQILPKTAQNCQNLQKSAQQRNFEVPPKIEILVFFKNENFYV